MYQGFYNLFLNLQATCRNLSFLPDDALSGVVGSDVEFNVLIKLEEVLSSVCHAIGAVVCSMSKSKRVDM